MAMTMCEEKKALKERLGAIIKSKKHTRAAVVMSVVLLASAVLTACALGAGSALPLVRENTFSPQSVKSLLEKYLPAEVWDKRLI